MPIFSERIKQCWNGLIHGFPEESQPMDVYTLLSMSYLGQALCVATKVGVIDQLANGPKTAANLAQLTGVDRTYLLQILRALDAWKLLAHDKLGLYRLTPISETLIEPGSWLRHHMDFWSRGFYPSASKMDKIVKSDQNDPGLPSTETIFSNLYSQWSNAKQFIDYMSFITDIQSSAIVSHFDFTHMHHVVDIGGGRASLMSAVLQANPHLNGTIFDLPCMKEEVNQRISQENLADRCQFVGGNFLESVPANADVYLIKHVLHDWPDNKVSQILKAISEAMSEDSLLIIIEAVIDDTSGTEGILKLASLERMFMTGGLNHTQHEFELLLLDAKLRLKEVRHTSHQDCSMIIASKQRDSLL